MAGPSCKFDGECIHGGRTQRGGKGEDVDREVPIGLYDLDLIQHQLHNIKARVLTCQRFCPRTYALDDPFLIRLDLPNFPQLLLQQSVLQL